MFAKNSLSTRTRKLKKPYYHGGRKAVIDDIGLNLRTRADVVILSRKINELDGFLFTAAQIISKQQSAIEVLQATVRGIGRQETLTNHP